MLGGGSEPKIISTMAPRGYSQHANHVSLFENPNADEVIHNLIRQHKSRKVDDPVSIHFLIFFEW